MADLARATELMSAYISGMLTEPERLELMDWVAGSPHNKEMFERITNPDVLLRSIRDRNMAKKRVWERLNKKLPELQPAKHVKVRPLFTRTRVAVAAAIIIVAGCFAWYVLHQQEQDLQVVQASPLPPDVYAMPDQPGSKMKNTPGLSVVDTSQDTRSFPVPVDSAGKEVAVSHLNGTYADTPVKTVHMFSGEVKLKENQTALVLLPGQKLRVDTETRALEIMEDTTVIMTLRKGVFSFEDAPAKSVMALIQTWFNVQVLFEQQDLQHSKISGSFTKEDNIFRVKSMLEKNGLIVKFNDPTLTLSRPRPVDGIN